MDELVLEGGSEKGHSPEHPEQLRRSLLLLLHHLLSLVLLCMPDCSGGGGDFGQDVAHVKRISLLLLMEKGVRGERQGERSYCVKAHSRSEQQPMHAQRLCVARPTVDNRSKQAT